jgi:RNA polymerase sigma-70 factor (ECF subfamily)
VVLEQQDRSLWDRPRIEGLCPGAPGPAEPGVWAYTVQAAIAAVHAEAATAEETDWGEIVGLYDVLQRYGRQRWWS